jgi:hypothetical protein
MCKLSSSKYLPNFDLMTSKNVLCAYLRKLIIIIRERERKRELESRAAACWLNASDTVSPRSACPMQCPWRPGLVVERVGRMLEPLVYGEKNKRTELGAF